MKLLRYLLPLFLLGCSGPTGPSGSEDWLVVQYRADGTPARCWRLPLTNVTRQSYEGIYWRSPRGNRVTIVGWYNAVEVERQDWEGAGRDLGVDPDRCKSGAYDPPPPPAAMPALLPPFAFPSSSR